MVSARKQHSTLAKLWGLNIISDIAPVSNEEFQRITQSSWVRRRDMWDATFFLRISEGENEPARQLAGTASTEPL